MSSKAWSLCALILVVVLLTALAVPTVIIDPLFHFHAPLEELEYPLNNQRYQNDGITRHFTYDALITGTSMSENFKTSEFDALFGTHSVKVCFSGGTYEELVSSIKKAMARNPDIRYVVCALDEWNLYGAKNLLLADGAHPTYLYDENPFNDVNYLLNKEVLLGNTLDVLKYTRDGKTTTSFDDYSSWGGARGREVLLKNYDRYDEPKSSKGFTREEADALRASLENDLLAMAREYPDTQFLYFFPPYSVVNWNSNIQEGWMEARYATFNLTSEILTQAENIQLYSFYDDYETCTDLDNYHDTVHYSSDINSLMLRRMRDQEYRLTQENYRAHWDAVWEYYENYDYDALFAEPIA